MMLPILNAIGARRLRRQAQQGVYGYSIGLKAFLWIGSVLWIAAPFCFEIAGVRLSVVDWLAGGAADVFILTCSMYADRYMVELGSSSIRYGAFLRKEVPYDQIVSMKLHVSNSGTKFCNLKLSCGGVVKLDGNMAGFEDLLRKLRGLAGSNAICEGFDSVARLR